MYTSFEELADSSRLWIYQASRAFTESEQKQMDAALHSFCNEWAAHGHPLKTSFKIAYNQFIVLAADESYHLPSGCSIDSSVHVIKAIQEQTQIDFFDRTQIAFRIGEEVRLFSLSQLKHEFASGTLNGETPAFNNLVATKAEWAKNWIAPARATWISRYLPKAAVVS